MFGPWRSKPPGQGVVIARVAHVAALARKCTGNRPGGMLLALEASNRMVVQSITMAIGTLNSGSHVNVFVV